MFFSNPLNTFAQAPKGLILLFCGHIKYQRGQYQNCLGDCKDPIFNSRDLPFGIKANTSALRLLEKKYDLETESIYSYIQDEDILNCVPKKPIGREKAMDNWIPFAEGEYVVDQAFIIAPDERAVAIEDAYIEIFATAQGQRCTRLASARR